MHNFTVARPYAHAVFAEALAMQQLENWSQCLQVLSFIAGEERIQELMSSPKVSSAELQTLFVEVTANVVDVADNSKLTNFIALLAAEKRLNVLGDIYLLFQQLLAEYKNTVEIEVFSAYDLSTNQQQELEQALTKRFARQVSVKYGIDRTLIGGTLIRAGNWVMDGSVKGKLTRLGEELLS